MADLVFDVQMKLIVIGTQYARLSFLPAAGDAGVGKSCILHRFVENRCKLAIGRKKRGHGS